MTGLIVRHFYFWRRVIPADRVWVDRSTYGEDLYERVTSWFDGCERLRFIPQSSIVSRGSGMKKVSSEPGSAISADAATPKSAAISPEAAHSLAVRYNAYCTAEDDNALRVWGRLMLQSIEETGLFEQFRETITDRIEHSLRRKQFERERAEYAAVSQ